MTTLATLVVKVVGDINDYTEALNKSQAATETFAGRATSGLSALGGSVVVGGLTAAATATTAIGVAAWNAAETMDKAYDTIQIQTGATGETLKTLQGDFDSVFAKVPTDAQQAADVISGLNQKLGLTGPVLDDASVKLLNMTNLLGGDAKTNAELFGRTMQDAGLPVDQAGVLLDKLFVASQKSGIGVDSLMQKMVQFGAPMRNMGFDLDTSIALFAKWEKEGVNAELVMGSLRIAAGNFAKEGKPLNEGLAETIEKIKGAKDASEALVIAQGIFGARAAGDMAAAIREGRFDIEDLTAALQNSQGAIDKTAESTLDWDGKWKMFTNNLTISLSPIGDTLREIASEAMDMLNSFLSRPEVQQFIQDVANRIAAFGETVQTWLPLIQDWLQSLWKWLGENQGVIIAILAAIGAAIVVWAITSLGAIIPLVAGMLPVLIILALIGIAVYILYLAWTNNWFGIREKTAEVWAWLEPKLIGIKEWLEKDLPKAISDLSAIWEKQLLPAIQETWPKIEARIAEGVDYLTRLFDDLSVVFEVWKTNNILLFEGFWAIVHGDWKKGGEKLGQMTGNTFDLLDEITSGRLKSLADIWNFGLDDILFMILNVKDWEGVGRKVMDLIIQGFNFGLDDLFGLIATVFGGIVQAVSEFLSGFMSGMFKAEDVQKIIDDAHSKIINNLPSSESPTQQNTIGTGSESALPLPKLSTGIKPKTESTNTGGTVVNVNVDNHPLVSGSDEKELKAKLTPVILDILKQYKVQLNP